MFSTPVEIVFYCKSMLFTFEKRMGRRQVVRHLVLVQAFGGSNPSAPVCYIYMHVIFIFLFFGVRGIRTLGTVSRTHD